MRVTQGEEVILSLDHESHTLTISPVEIKTRWPFKESDLLIGMNNKNCHSELLADPTNSEIGG